MSEQTIDFDANPPVATNEYDDMVRIALPGYKVMHTIVLSFLRFHLPETANLLIVGAGTGMELIRFSKSNSQWHMLGVVLVSGDGDLADAVQAVSARGARVEVMSLRTMTSESLISVADCYTDLEEIKEHIQKTIKNPLLVLRPVSDQLYVESVF